MTTIVALDIETTGLDPAQDSIIEIGAVRFKDHRVEDEWSTLVHPGRHIPEFISNLTGINDEMVRGAPSIEEVLPELEEFVGRSPVLGHNVRFDLGFLRRHKLFALNEIIDTYELAAVLLPDASRYNLGALGRQLGVMLPATHRALDDARVTHAIYTRLYEMARQLPLDLIAEITRLCDQVEWDAAWVFRQIMKARSREAVPARQAYGGVGGPLFEALEREGEHPPLQAADPPVPVDPDEAAAFLEHGGPFARYFEAYEYRPEQVAMLRAVTEALSQGKHLMVEAGTGVGKSFAYLVPAALFALRNNTRVVISTNTLNLQDQLFRKDIPDLSAALRLNLRATVLKGRGNYLCPRRLEILRHRGPETTDEMRVLAKVLVWLRSNQSGDRNEINLTGPAERDVWLRISAEDDACTAETCLRRTGGACPFYRARQAAQSAHLVIVNHALLLADVATGSRVLPEYSHLIVDEAHHLESATTGALSFRLAQFDFERMLRELGGTSSGLLGRLLSAAENSVLPSDYAALRQTVEHATDLAFRVQEQARDFFAALGGFVATQREGKPPSNYAYQQRIVPATRAQPGWQEVELAWGVLTEPLGRLLIVLEKLQRNTADLYAAGGESLEDLVGDLGNLFRRLKEATEQVNALISEPAPGRVYWIEVQPGSNRVVLQSAPLRVGELIEKYLWHEKASIVLTSATLTTHNGFRYMRRTLGADEAEELELGSPFDYENSTLLFVANDIPEPNAPGYQLALEKALIRLCQAVGGRTLVLFTSYAQLKRTSQAIAGPLAQQDILVYEQGEGASPNTLVESFRETDRAVLLGTRSFWEGVDIPGQALSVVVIPKLPFDVPTDPLIEARSETYEDAFNEYYMPEAVLKFRQGFGRLIRTQSDRGVVALLDRRLLTKKYGQYFRKALPRCTEKIAPLAELPKLAAKWLE